MSCLLRSDTLRQHQSDSRHRSSLIPTGRQNDDTNRVDFAARTGIGRCDRSSELLDANPRRLVSPKLVHDSRARVRRVGLNRRPFPEISLRSRPHERVRREMVQAPVVFTVAAWLAGICHHCDCAPRWQFEQLKSICSTLRSGERLADRSAQEPRVKRSQWCRPYCFQQLAN